MTVTADDGTRLVGTLTLPPGDGPHPAALLLHGSGPLDRDGNTPKIAMNLGPAIAAALAAQGVATLRYDRRGAGATADQWRTTGFTDNRRDAASALRQLAEHPAIRPDAVAAIGHSEGSLHAMSLGAGGQAQAVVLLAGFANRGEDALRWQSRAIVRSLPAPLRLLRRPVWALIDRIVARIKRTDTDSVRVAGFPLNARWLREMIAHDTRDELATVKAPVLAVTGTKDLQVDPADLDEIRRLVPGETEIHLVPDLTHVLRRDPGRHSLLSYSRLLRSPVDPELMALTASWLAARLDASPGEAPADREPHHS